MAIERVCVVGGGVIGSLYAGHLARTLEVSVLTRREEHARALVADGLRISGKSEFTVGVHATTDPAELPDFDLGILSTKGSLYVTRPTLATHIASRAELVERSNALFEIVKSGKVKIETTKTYRLEDAAQAHRDLEGRKTTGSVILVP